MRQAGGLPLAATALAWVTALGVTGGAAPTGAADAAIARGRLFYLTGNGPNGAVAATLERDIPVSSAALPCANCHRRSGWGSVEGPVTVPPVVGPVLFAPVTLGNEALRIRTSGPGTRPAYTVPTLLRAIRDGVDPSGRTLSPTMPRYQISDEDAGALAAYLRTLAATPPPGVTDSTVSFATIVTPGVDEGTRRSMLAALHAFAESKNAETRHETRRREHGPWDMKWMYELYRDWSIQEWVLTGDPSSWRAQLDRYYQQQPVFAVLSGAGSGDWTPIHRFCEDTALPCIFPQAAAPPDVPFDQGFYSLYFSKGVSLEAAAIGAHLAGASATPERVRQVVPCGAPSPAAAALTATLPARFAIETRCVNHAAGSAREWQAALDGTPPTVIAWLNRDDLERLGNADLTAISTVYVSSSLIGDDFTGLPASLLAKMVIADPFVAPDRLEQHARRSIVWLDRQHADPTDRRASINALFAATVIGDALRAPRALLSREYFIEQIEHMVARTPTPSAFRVLGLSARRRYASLGCTLLKPPLAAGQQFTEVQPWFVPDYTAKEKH